MADDVVYDTIVAYVGTYPVKNALKATNNNTAVPMRFENTTDFQKPEPPAPWIAMAMTGVLYGQESLGASVQAENRWDEGGHLWFLVFVPRGIGASLARKIAKTMANQFRGLDLLAGSLEFMDAFIGEGEPAPEEGNYYKLPVSIEWRHIDA